MPFTFSHPAIVLPLRRLGWVSFPALVFGSMAPDFEYFLRMQPYSVYSHTLLGLFCVDLPLVIVLYVLYRYIVEKGLLAVLPLWAAKGLASGRPQTRSRRRTWVSLVVFAYSALLGSYSHIAWDAFTHDGGSMVERFAFLQQRIPLLFLDVPVYKLLQHGSTLLGGLAIAFVLWRTGRKNDHVEIKQATLYGKGLFWLGVAVIGLGVVVWHAFFVKGVSPLIHPLQQVVPFLSGSLLGICLLAPLANRPGLKK
ncbi:hypothetical protein BAG01nite_07940 [Brevibacillus agri]|uniref:DUF4184 family protein n=1 Tax=Brevibacillus agri TaxID=51101 RepID=A0A3M8BBA6_9BACL|nr:MULTISPECIES: DUF4184 family protein [Brevibacillus]EJL39442.1 hypothetical protein PMI08_04954 [Brevibacillus sp. CF112]MBG9565907.1 hypothetical protein [Brevibacillus agri]MCG5254829.1 DUF4184 family protein [Brevibacillus agri]MED1645109.1 DUF4184 family protein [Brevibacillus agri]MED1654101.1 DUF4184 family protein [Brevibacillus agri]